MSPAYVPPHRLPVKMANSIVRAGRSLGIKKRPLDTDRLMSFAKAMTGLKDFGNPAFEEPLRLLVDDMNRDGDLHEIGPFFHWFFLSGFLRNRLRLVEAWKRTPEALQQKVNPPLIILGLPRTATTRLFNVLAAAPDHRTLTFWEASGPVKAKGEGWLPINPRRAKGRLTLGAIDFLAPNFKSIHELLLDGPEECIHLLANSFASWIFPVEYNAPNYIDWFGKTDHLVPYQEFKAQLQLLQMQKPTQRWLLKSPHHLFGIEALMKVFPDAMIIQTHRDPVKVVPSCCSLAQTTRGLASTTLDPHELGSQILDQLSLGLERTANYRLNIPARQIIDIQYQDIIAEPFDVCRRIYDHFGLELDDETERALRHEISVETHNQHGKHTYTAQQFGLSRDLIEERFSTYYEAFNVAKET